MGMGRWPWRGGKLRDSDLVPRPASSKPRALSNDPSGEIPTRKKLPEAKVSDAVVGVRPAGLGEEAAVDAEGLAANERGAFAQQELDSGSDVVGCADAAKRRKAGPGIREAGDLFFGAFGVDRPRGHAIHANSEWAQFQRGGFGEHFDAAFAGGVAGKIGEGNFVATGADVDDGAGAVFFHVASGALRAQVTAFKIGGNYTIPFRFFDV